MKLYVINNETNQYVDTIEGEDNADCEAQVEAKWGSNDYSTTYSPGLDPPCIGDFATD